MMHHPKIKEAQGLESRNVWEWLASKPASKHIFDFLTQPDVNGDRVIDMFCKIYNRRAIPNRKAVPLASLVKLSEPEGMANTTQERLDILADEPPFTCEVLVVPAPVDDQILGLLIYPAAEKAAIYNWTEKRELETKVREVSHRVAGLAN
jgi:hypothetical protein